ncbi:MAG TPA: hypothetical protein VK540_26760 [Polyangiaceae bacterium]|nr:hypothetical protein [Polyangiaceae bacterium]
MTTEKPKASDVAVHVAELLTQCTPSERVALVGLIVDLNVGGERVAKRKTPFNVRGAFELYGALSNALLELCPPKLLATVHQHIHVHVRQWAELASDAEGARRAGKRPTDHRGQTIEEKIAAAAAKFDAFIRTCTPTDGTPSPTSKAPVPIH